jgi:glucosylceramidase
MSMLHTRRDVMKIAGAGFAGLAAARSAQAAVQPAGALQVRRTYGAQRFAAEGAVPWRAGGTPSPADIRVDPDSKFQEMLGFGASLTDAACYLINQLAPAPRAALIRELFHPAETGLTISRLGLGASDYATKHYTYDDGAEDVDMTRFSVAHDHEYIIPIVAACRQANPDLFLLGSPWSPPGWMKANGSTDGGSMKKKYFAAYAKYFVKAAQAYAGAGVPLDAITVQNEVDTDQDGRMPACLWGQEYEIEFIAKHLGPQFAAAGVATKIWFLDHNYNLWGRAICTLDDPGVSTFVDGVAWHGYAGTPDMMTKVHDAHPAKHTYWTEGGPSVTNPTYETEWVRWSSTFAGILRNWARCIIGWNMALDEKGRPNIGPFACGGVLTIDSTTHAITRSGMYWALVHHSRSIRKGARRIGSEGTIEGVTHVAFSNPDGSSAVVLTNAGAARTVHLCLAAQVADVDLPADSITSLTWS